LVTGPTPSAAPNRRAWRLLFGGVSQIELVVRPPAEAGPQPLVMVRQQNVQALSPSQALCDFSLDLDVRHGGVRELRLEYEPGLRPIDVSVRNLARWQIVDGDEDTPNQILVEFTEPFRGGSLTVRAVGPVPTNRPWVSPWVRVSGGVPRGEQIVIQGHPELAYEDWKAGSFRLQDVAASADRSVVWTLQGGAARAAPTRPSARVRLRGPEYYAHQKLWWHVEPGGGESLTANCSFDVRRGPVFQVPWSVPADWMVRQVEATPADALASWSVFPPMVSGGPATLTVEFLHALVPACSTQLKLTLARGRTESILKGPARLTVPDVRPLAAGGREGTLAVKVAPEYLASWNGAADTRGILSSPVSSPPADMSPAAPWAPAAPDFVFNLGPHELAGRLALRPVPARFRARVSTTLFVVGRLARITHRLALEPLFGGTETVLVQTTSGEGGPWQWRVISGDNRVRTVQRADVSAAVARAALAAASPWAAVVPSAPAHLRGNLLQAIGLERPLTSPIELQADIDLHMPLRDATRTTNWVAALAAGATLPTLPLAAAAGAAGEWPLVIPLVSVTGAAASESTVTIDLTAAGGVEFRSKGLRELPTPQTSTRRRHFASGPGPASVWLTPGEHVADGVVRGATLRTDMSVPDRQVHRLHFRLQDWTARDVRVGLPNQAIVQRGLIDGTIAPVKPPSPSSEGLELTIGLPRGGPEIELAVVFATPQSPWRIASRVLAPMVRLPGTTSLRHIWHFPPAVIPIEPAQRRNHPTSASHDAALPGEWMSEDQGTTIWVVREDAVTATGFALAAAVVIGVALSGARARLVSLGAMTAGGLLVLWLPGPIRPVVWWPFVVALIVAGGAWAPIRGDASSAGESSGTVRRTGSSSRNVVVGVALFVWLGTSGRAAAPAPATVYCVAGPDGGVTTVLVPADLMEQLREMERGGVTSLDGVRVTAARYTGRIDGPAARFQGVFDLHSFSDGSTTLTLPLTGIVLRDARLDGGPAYPRASGDRYSVVVRGRGRHVLELSFQTAVTGMGNDKEIRFGGPDAVQSVVALELTSGARGPHAVFRRGAQTVTTTGDHVRLEADLGRAAVIHLRWQTAAAADASPATVGVQEAYLWDISSAGATLYGALRYTIGGGSVSSLTVELPKDLAVAAVNARPLDAAPSGAPVGWLRHWQTATHDRGSRLTLEFGVPVSGNWQVALGLVPRAPWPAAVTLSFPAADGTKTVPPAYAYRARDLAVGLTRTTGVAPMTEDLFLRDRWLPPQVEADPPRPTRAFQRTAGGAPTLRLTVAPPSPELGSVESWTWSVGPERAEVRTESRVSAHRGAVWLLEWDVPAAVRVLDLRGPDVSHWTRTGGRLQVWLRRPVADAVIQWTGMLGRAGKDPPGPPAAGPTRFDLPVIRPTTIPFRGTIRVAAASGWLLTPLLTTHLRPGDAAHAGDRSATYLTESPAYQAAFQVRSTPSDEAFRMTTLADVRDGSFHADTTIERSGGLAAEESWLVTARSAGNFQYRINAPGARVREVAEAPNRRAWSVEWPALPRATGRMTVQATTAETTSAERPPEWNVPHIDLAANGGRPHRLEHTINLAKGLAAVEVEGLRPTGGPNEWAARDDGWRMRIRPLTGPRQAELRASAAEILRGDDGQKIIRLRCDVAVPSASTLNWTWVDAVRVLSVRVDDGRLVSPPGETTAFEFAVDDRPGLRRVILDWVAARPDRQQQMPTLIIDGRTFVVPPQRIALSSAHTPSWLQPLGRTVLLTGLLGGLWWWRRIGDIDWPERLVVLGIVGWVAAGGWYWLLPIIAGFIARARMALRAANRRQRLATAPSALSS